MSTTNPDYSTVIVPLFKTYGQAIQPTLVILMLNTVFGAMLVPLLVALVYFSTPKHRQVYMFWFVTLDVILGIAVAAWYGSALTGIILDPLGAVPVATYIALTILPSLSGCMVDLTLMLRLYAVYPLQSTRKSRFMVIFCIPAAIKVARIVLKIIILVMVARKTTAYIKEGGMDSVSIGNALIDMPTIKIEACCALVDHMFVSASFLLKLYGGFARSGDSSRITNGSQASIASRIRTLFQIALSNLIFTVIFDVVTLVILFSHPSLKAVYIMATNLYVSIIGVVFATVWSSSSTMLDKSTSQSSTPAGLSVLRFQRDVVTFTDSSPEFKHADSQYTNTTESDGPFETNLERSTRNLPFNSDIKAGE